MNQNMRCFTPSILKALSHGYYSEPLLYWYLHHLDQCSECRSKLITFRRQEDSAQIQQLAEDSKYLFPIGSGDSSFDLPCLDKLGLEPPTSSEELARLGDFRVLRTIGRGQSSIIFEAEDLWLSRQVVLKLLRKDLGSQMEGRLIFLAEAKAIAAIHHENVLPILNIGQEGEEFYLVMPMLPGESLKSALATRRFSLRQALAITRQTAAGLAAIHKAGLLHCDLKPSNIWLQAMPDGTEKAVILDFGFSALNSLRLRHRIQSDLAPEQIAGGQVDARTDLFSLGRLLLTLLHEYTNEEQPAGATIDRLMTKRLAPVVPLLDRLLAHDPNDRPADADAVVRLIDQMQNSSRRRWLLTAGVAASAACGTVIYNQLAPRGLPSTTVKMPNSPRAELQSKPRQILSTIKADVALPIGNNSVIEIDHVRQNLIWARPDGSVAIQQIASGSRPGLSFQCGFKPVQLSLCPRGHKLAAVSGDGLLKVWSFNKDATQIQSVTEFELKFEKLQDMSWTDEARPRIVLATSSHLHLINPALNLNSPGFQESHKPDYPIRKIHVRPGFHEIVCVVEDGGLLIWDINKKAPKAGVRTFMDKSVHFATSSTGKSLGSSSHEGILVRYDGHTYPPRHSTHAPFWQAEYVSYFYKPSNGLTFVSDSVVLIQIEANERHSAQFLMMNLQKPARECIMRFNDNKIVRMFNSADEPRLYCMNDKGEFLVCDLSPGIAQLAAPV